MPLVNSNQLLNHAKLGAYAIGAFNAHYLDMIPFYIDIAEEYQIPLIIQTSTGTVEFSGIESIAAVTKEKASRVSVPVVLHLDHCETFEGIVRAVRAGYTSVMIDGSKLSLEDNIQLTKKVVEVARACGVSVEGELGYVAGRIGESGQEDDGLTDPEQAKVFVEETGVDSLAVAIGTVHGFYKGKPNIHFERLKQIEQMVSVPLVLHGGSGLETEVIDRLIQTSIAKINVATELKYPWAQGIRQYLQQHENEIDPRLILSAGRRALRQSILDYSGRFHTPSIKKMGLSQPGPSYSG